MKTECRKMYEIQFRVDERTEENWYQWRAAWNAALRHLSNATFKNQEPI